MTNKIRELWIGKIGKDTILTIDLPDDVLIKAIRIHAPKSMLNSKVVIGNYMSETLVDGKLWWFDGGLIPLDLDTKKCFRVHLKIENRTTRKHKIKALIVTEED